jgi:hypothetical protein
MESIRVHKLRPPLACWFWFSQQVKSNETLDFWDFFVPVLNTFIFMQGVLDFMQILRVAFLSLNSFASKSVIILGFKLSLF